MTAAHPAAMFTGGCRQSCAIVAPFPRMAFSAACTMQVDTWTAGYVV